ncbi:MAG: PEP-CTERM-box response regulator transcription factor [Burkholderiales bacterium]|nr:PEP-CTERM-box response regulator transcription factor [Burkholderiales bacterium]
MSKNGKANLLVVEDDPGLQKQMRWGFDNYEVLIAGDCDSAIAQMRRFEPAVMTLDLGLPPDPDGVSQGFETLRKALELFPDTKVIVITGNQDRAHAVNAIGMGAYDFYQKPFDPDMLGLIIDRAFRLHQLQQENRKLQLRAMASPSHGILTGDPAMQRVVRTVEKLAPSDATVLLLGESGTGKELLARALHDLSVRSANRFVAINCAAIPENLLESELFGYEKGAFTGAVKQTRGKIEYANAGTLFLDEVGDLPPALQAKLLRFLQERVVERIGGREEIPVDVRIVCATHQNLKDMMDQARFREDLYYRLSEIVIDIPALRNRDGDSLLLARAFLAKFTEQQSKPTMHFSEEAAEAIEAHAWPGNVRQLENAVKRAVIMAEGSRIARDDLGLSSDVVKPEPVNLRQVRDEAERKAVVRALGRTDGNLVKAAELLGVSRPTLYDLLNRYGLKAGVRPVL